MPLFSKDKSVGFLTTQGLNDFNFPSLETQARKVENLVSMMLVMKKAFHLESDDIVDLSTENK